jgi:hypothetical protein
MEFSARKISQLVKTEKASAKKMLTITQLALQKYHSYKIIYKNNYRKIFQWENSLKKILTIHS